MITREEPPVPVELPPTLTPATLPERALPRFGSRAIVKSSPPTCVVGTLTKRLWRFTTQCGDYHLIDLLRVLRQFHLQARLSALP